MDAMEPRPVLLIAGFPKCGTTTLYEAAARQKALAFQPEKESRFFTTHPLASLVDYDRSVDTAAAAVADATPYYACYPFIRDKVRAHPARVAAILAIRDPVERVRSEWRMYRTRGREALDINRALEENLKTQPTFDSDFADADAASRELANARRERRRTYIEASMYAKCIRNWSEVLPAEGLRVVDFSSMTFQECVGELFGCMKYLGLRPESHDLPELKANQSLDPRLRPLYSVFSPGMLQAVRHMIPRPFRSRLRAGFLRLAKGGGNAPAGEDTVDEGLAKLLYSLSGYQELQARMKSASGGQSGPVKITDEPADNR